MWLGVVVRHNVGGKADGARETVTAVLSMPTPMPNATDANASVEWSSSQVRPLSQFDSWGMEAWDERMDPESKKFSSFSSSSRNCWRVQIFRRRRQRKARHRACLVSLCTSKPPRPGESGSCSCRAPPTTSPRWRGAAGTPRFLSPQKREGSFHNVTSVRRRAHLVRLSREVRHGRERRSCGCAGRASRVCGVEWVNGRERVNRIFKNGFDSPRKKKLSKYFSPA